MTPDLRARVLAAAARTPSPTRREEQRRVLVVTAVGVALSMVLFFLMGGLRMGARPAALVAFSTGLSGVAAIIATRLTARPSMLGPPRQVLLAACFALAPALALVAIAAAILWPTEASEKVPTTTDAVCGALTMAQAAPLLGILLIPRWGADPVHPALTGAALGASAGAWAAMLAYLRCPHADAHHCIHGHVFPVIVLAVLGAVLGRWTLRVSAR
jgi:hypothetical protein